MHAGPLAGAIAPQYDSVGGRFRLHVGAYRDKDTGLTQKIPWFLPARNRSGGLLVVRGRRLAPPGRTFKQSFDEAGSPDPKQRVFPSTISPPASGCWKLTFQTGRVTASLRVWVHDG